MGSRAGQRCTHLVPREIPRPADESAGLRNDAIMEAEKFSLSPTDQNLLSFTVFLRSKRLAGVDMNTGVHTQPGRMNTIALPCFGIFA
jgi:hypothetical protein